MTAQCRRLLCTHGIGVREACALTVQVGKCLRGQVFAWATVCVGNYVCAPCEPRAHVRLHRSSSSKACSSTRSSSCRHVALKGSLRSAPATGAHARRGWASTPEDSRGSFAPRPALPAAAGAAGVRRGQIGGYSLVWRTIRALLSNLSGLR